MDESITRAAGSTHGQEMTPQAMENLLATLARPSRQRTTLYANVDKARAAASFVGRNPTAILA